MEVDSVIQFAMIVSSRENITTSMISLILELVPLLSAMVATSQPLVTTLEPFVAPFSLIFLFVPNLVSILEMTQFAEPSQQSTSRQGHYDKFITNG